MNQSRPSCGKRTYIKYGNEGFTKLLLEFFVRFKPRILIIKGKNLKMYAILLNVFNVKIVCFTINEHKHSFNGLLAL